MIIKSSTKDYRVHLEQDFAFFDSLLASEQALFAVDKKLYELYKAELFGRIPEEKLFLIEALEENKNIETALAICERMTEIPGKRNARLISFGGGIVQDITGFAANILYRGIHWTFVPTTLLAACDSCIGGKTSLNYKSYKNLLGTFFPPEDIYICPKFFATLSERDFESGLGEVVKFNIMSGEAGLEKIEANLEGLLERKPALLEEFLKTSLQFKKTFIEEDEFDRGIRIHLNFAHTFGHAFETISHYQIPHGTAVAMGMIVADRVSVSRGCMEESICRRAEEVLKKIIHVDLDAIDWNMDAIVKAIRKDKKQIDDALTCVLLKQDMKLKVVHDLKREEIEMAVNAMLDLLKENMGEEKK